MEGGGGGGGGRGSNTPRLATPTHPPPTPPHPSTSGGGGGGGGDGTEFDTTVICHLPNLTVHLQSRQGPRFADVESFPAHFETPHNPQFGTNQNNHKTSDLKTISRCDLNGLSTRSRARIPPSNDERVFLFPTMIRPWTIGVCTVQKEAMDSPMPVLHQSSFQACSIPKQLLFIHCTSFSALCMRSFAATPTIYTRRKRGPWGFCFEKIAIR
ncbi:hypothetical protein CCUS01_07362 [Colletotrichum cuscutae]|uniref:Uncharacterized protein n=1 Tax=Colletotrichum cuscutae TaxID=1209917 RepID=A0AAI9V0N3_9PEZI|nr:hypothetical protein CCUS01_07362 [Colletotrichum cuscutae]